MYHTFFNGKYISDSYTPDNYTNQERYIFLEQKIQEHNKQVRKKYESQLLDQKNIFNHANCFMILDKKDSVCEYYIFYTASNCISSVNYYINRLHTLETFITKFKITARNIIFKADQDRLIKPWRNIGNISISRKRYAINNENMYLTNREIQVARYIVQGKSARESAAILGISRRSVETHIENIKLKFNCKKKIDLAFKLKDKLNEIYISI